MIKKTLFLLAFLIICFGCDEERDTTTKPQNNSINKILPLGASRVEGARPEYESYRYELWKKLIETNLVFDFVGTQTDKFSYPQFNKLTFDSDHEGRGGWTSVDILQELTFWLNQIGQADIVLLSSPGGNDALEGLSYSQAVANINGIIDILQAHNPNTTIIIEQMAPARTNIMNSELTEFIEQMQNEVLNIAESKTSATSDVLTVDMFSGFNDNLLADDVHYNEEGAKFIANRYYNLLVYILE